MSDDQSGSDEVVTQFASIFESEPTEPTDEADEADDVETDEVDTDDAGGAEADDDDEADDEPEDGVLRGPKTAKYEFDEESGTYSFSSDGKTIKADIAKLIDNYQLGEKFTQKSMDLSNKEKARAKEHSEHISALNAKAQELKSYSDGLLELLNEEQKALDDQLDYLDFAEYTKRSKALEARRNKIESAAKSAGDHQKTQFNDQAKTEFGKLKSVMKWDSEDKLQAGMKTISKYAEANGMTAEDVSGVISHKIYKALHDAAKYHELLSKKDKAVKEVKSAPKSVKSKKQTPKAKDPINMSLDQALYG